MARRLITCLVALVGTAAVLAGTAGAAGRIDINTAGITELTGLPRIGPRTAEAIVAYRSEHGPFRSIDELLEVPRIGPKTLEGLRDLITVKGGSGKARKAPAAAAREAPRQPAAEALPPERVLPEGFCSLNCWSCGKLFYLACDVEHGFCPYCGKQWQRNEGNEP